MFMQKLESTVRLKQLQNKDIACTNNIMRVTFYYDVIALAKGVNNPGFTYQRFGY